MGIQQGPTMPSARPLPVDWKLLHFSPAHERITIYTDAQAAIRRLGSDESGRLEVCA